MSSDSCFFLWSLKPSDCAAWVQAWGSILAIFAAAAIAFAQAWAQRRSRSQAEGIAAAVAASSIFESLRTLKGFIASIRDMPDSKLPEPNLALSMAAMLAEIPVPTEHETLLLVPAKPRTAARLVGVLNLIKQLKLTLKVAGAGLLNKPDLDLIRRMAGQACDGIFDVEEQLQILMALYEIPAPKGGLSPAPIKPSS